MLTATPQTDSRHALAARTALGALAILAACGDPPTAARAPARPSAATDGVHQELAATQRPFTFTTIEVPEARSTGAQGIDSRGNVVGIYVDAGGRTHGFLLTRESGAFTTIDYPGALITEARGIAADGEIVGTYRMPGEPAVNVHGFRRTPEGEFAPVDFPGHTNTIAQRILPDGTILGCRHDSDFMETMRGVVMGPGGDEEIEAFASMHNGATPDLRRITGLYTNMMAGNPTTGRQEGYLIEDGVFTPLLVPGSVQTAGWDMNPAGDVVGVYRDAAGFHGFLLTDEGYQAIDVPGAAATRAFGINPAGDVVGTFTTGVGAEARTRAFVARGGGNAPPTVEGLRLDPAAGPYSIAAKACGGRYTACVRFQVADPDGAADGPFQVTLDWGDGGQWKPNSVPAATPLLAPHDYAAPGTYTVRVTVTDRHGATGTAGATLAVTP